MRFLEIQSWILLSLLLVLAGVFPAGAQDCENSGAGMVSAQGYSYVEPGELSSCIIGQTPKDRKYVVLIYEIEFADSVFAGRNDSAIEMNVSVSVAGQPLFTERKIVAAEMFSGIARVLTGYWGGPVTVYNKRRVEKFIPVGQWTAAGPVSAQLTVGARRTGTLPTDEDSVHITATLHADIRLTVQETPYSFLPLNSADPPAVSGCTAGQDDKNCFPTFLARIAYAVPEDQVPRERRLNGRIRFVLERVSELIGSSTNFGSEETPDYKIEPNRQTTGLFDTLEGNRAVTKLLQRTDSLQAMLRLTSLDYAGTARLRAEFLPGGGEPFWPAEVDASASGAPGNQPANSACNCATLPYDKDGNEIADSWEDRVLGSGNRIDPLTDEEPGLGPTTLGGDGFISRDEYRGFHYISRADTQTNISFIRTNPRRDHDVFFWDVDGQVYTRLPEILGRQAAAVVYRELNREQANAAEYPRPTDQSWVERLDKNTRFGGRQRRARALVYLNRMLDDGIIGEAQTQVSDGTPMLIDVAQTGRWADRARMPTNVLLAQVTAHETGHKASLDHYYRQGSFGRQLSRVVLSPSQLGQLGPTEFVLAGDPSDVIYVRLQAYFDPLRGVEEIADAPEILSNGRVYGIQRAQPPTIAVEDPVNRFHVYKLIIKDRIRPVNNIGRPIQFQVKAGIAKLMDWKPRFTLRTHLEWTFLPADLERLCFLDLRCSF